MFTDLPPLPSPDTTLNPVTPSTNEKQLHTTSSPRPAITTSIKIPDNNFCATKTGGVYAKPDAPGSFYNCANGITWIQNCPANLVFRESCKCCGWP